MPLIVLETKIQSKIEICFDLSRSIDLHQISTSKSKEKAIAGKTSGLINLNEYVTWQAIHLGIKQKLSSKITGYNWPFHFRDEQIEGKQLQRFPILNLLFHFRDEQIEGPFKFIIHDHDFEQKENFVIMKDTFQFQSPYGLAGKIFDNLFLTNYMRKLLFERNEVIKEYAETKKWKMILSWWKTFK